MIPAARRAHHRVRIERRPETADDGAGNTLDEWQEVATLLAAASFERPKEAMAAGRLESSNTGMVTLRRSPTSTALVITAADRFVFTAGPYVGTVCNIRGVTPTDDRRWIECLVEIGVAT